MGQEALQVKAREVDRHLQVEDPEDVALTLSKSRSLGHIFVLTSAGAHARVQTTPKFQEVLGQADQEVQLQPVVRDPGQGALMEQEAPPVRDQEVDKRQLEEDEV